MKTRHITQSAPLGMTFLLLSFVLASASMKAAGFTPSLSGMVQAWNQIAGVFGSGYQPSATTELIAMNQPGVTEPSAPVSEPCCQQMVLASLEAPADVEMEVVTLVQADQVKSAEKPIQCPKAIKRATTRKSVETASSSCESASKKEFRVVAFDVQEMTNVKPTIPAEALKELEKRAAFRSFNLNRIMNDLPTPKEVKVLWKFKQTTAPAVSHISRCGDVNNPAPEPQKGLWRRQFTGTENVPTEGPESSEL